MTNDINLMRRHSTMDSGKHGVTQQPPDWRESREMWGIREDKD